MTARDKWIEMAEWCEKQACKSRINAADARSNREKRALRYRAQMHARLASYIRAHPDMPAVSPPKKAETRWQ
jgi:hypothetical protein